MSSAEQPRRHSITAPSPQLVGALDSQVMIKLLTAYCLLLTAYCLLLTAYCLLLTAYCGPSLRSQM
ncbi:MAG: hypothetical protein WAK31_24335 [Chthoniobacterales bacterium]